ncbi:MAG: BACON domain-containing carbohydrate-binding protein [Bryobacteraceae bacterium]
MGWSGICALAASGGRGLLAFDLAVRGGLEPRLSGDSVGFIDGSGAQVVRYSGLKAWDAAGKVLPTRFELAGRRVRMTVDERGAVYPVTVDPLVQMAYLKASNTGSGDGFGYSVAVSIDTVVVGAHLEDSIANTVNGDQANNSATDSGAAYVFTRDRDGAWFQVAYLKASNSASFKNFGYSVAISGDTIVVGAPNESGSGAAYVFIRFGGEWSLKARLRASNAGVGDGFGSSVAVYGETAVVGAPGEDSNATGVGGNGADNSKSNSGAAYVFSSTSFTEWIERAYLKASNTGADHFFGTAVAVSGQTVAVGAPGENSNFFSAGAGYVFVRSGATWSQQAFLKASNSLGFDLFGQSVALSGDTLVVGAPGEKSTATGVNGQGNNSLPDAGAAYVFVRAGSMWSQQAYLKASNTGSGHQFGWSVAASDNTVAVGALGENSNLANAGAAYVFVRNGGVWSQQAHLKASNSGAGDRFGRSVAVSSGIAVAGAAGEDSGATGINGDQNSNSAPDAGAAYTFGGDAVTVFQHTQYQGDSLAAYGDYINLGNVGWSNQISSIRVPPGWRITLYSQPHLAFNYTGVSRTFSADVPDLPSIPGPCGGSWNDCAQSFTIAPPGTAKFFYEPGYAAGNSNWQSDFPRLADYFVENAFSSLQVSLGWKVTLYSGPNYTGSSISFGYDIQNLPGVAGPCGGSWNNCAQSFRIAPTALWDITKTHSGNFARGQDGTYVIKVTNVGASATTPGALVQVGDVLPSGLTAVSAQGSGWSCGISPSVQCTRSDSLPAGTSYPDLQIKVNVTAGAPAAVTNIATVGGGGADANFGGDVAVDPTTIIDCSYLVHFSPGVFNPGAAGGSASVNVTTTSGCAWSAASNVPWITITGGASGAGDGPVTWQVAPNPNSTPRTGTLTIAGGTYTVTQAGVACSYTLSSPSASHGAGGGGAGLSVIAPGGCAWISVSDAPAWITITSATMGSGNGNVSYFVAANPSPAQRTGTLTIAGKTFTVTQAGAGCSYSILPTSAPSGSSGNGGGISVTAPPGCVWTAVSNVPWITVTGGAPGSGNGMVQFVFTTNLSSTPRSGTITIAGQTFTLNQAALGVPIVQGMAPTSGTGSSGKFTFNFSDSDSYGDLKILNVLVNNAIDGRNACYIAFVRSTGTLYLVNDAGQAGGPFAGSIIIPGAGTVSNGQCSINATGSTVSGLGNNFSLTLNMSFKAGFGGRRIMYVAARDEAENNSGWHPRGVWTVPFTQGDTAVVGMTPARIDGNTVTLSAVFYDVDGFSNLNVLNILINNGIDGRNACYIAYVRPTQTLLLVNDAGNAGGPFAGSIPIPGTGVASNSQCTINATGSGIVQSGTTVTLTLNLSFTGTFQGDRIVYAAARDVAENNSGWQAMATITVPPN